MKLEIYGINLNNHKFELIFYIQKLNFILLIKNNQ